MKHVALFCLGWWLVLYNNEAQSVVIPEKYENLPNCENAAKAWSDRQYRCVPDNYTSQEMGNNGT